MKKNNAAKKGDDGAGQADRPKARSGYAESHTTPEEVQAQVKQFEENGGSWTPPEKRGKGSRDE